MSSRDDAINAIRAINSNKDTILDAYFNDNGVIFDNLENEKVISTLSKYNLIFRQNDFNDVRLSKDLRKLLDRATSNFRRKSSHKEINDCFETLTFLLEQLNEARIRNRETDRLSIISEIEEASAELIECMRLAIANFTHYVSQGFAFTSDLELRIAENERVIKMAMGLNTILEELMNQDPYSMHGSNKELEPIFVNYLPTAITECTKDLNYANHKLRELLHKLKKNKETVLLIEAFEREFANNPGFSSDIEGLVSIPDVINIAPPLSMFGAVNIYDVSEEERVCKILDEVNRISDEKPQRAEPEVIPVSMDDCEDVTEDDEDGFIGRAATAVIYEVIDSEVSISAVEAYIELDMESEGVDPEHWILNLIENVYSLDDETRSRINLTFDENLVNPFTGAFDISDVYLEAA